MVGSILGTRVRRVEDLELIDGRSTFVDNLRVPGTAYAVFVRSPLAHARITHLGTSNAERAPGVLAVHTAATLGTEPVPAFMQINELVTQGPLADAVVRYVGDPVALVVAETRAQAVDAVELIDVDYDPLGVVVDMEGALQPDAPLQFPELGSNVAQSLRALLPPDAGDVLADAEVVVRARIENQRIAVAPMEGNAILVDPRPDGETLITAYISTQHPHTSRDMIATYTGIDPAHVRVVAPHVGGGFGAKAGIGQHHIAVVLAARALGRPVAWTETRSEAFLSMHGRAAVQFAELGLTREGRITGLRARNVGDCGAYAGLGGSLPAGPGFIMTQGPYEIPKIDYSAIAALTNTSPNGAFRGAGRPEATAMLERLMDLAALELGLTPEEIRRRNLIGADEFPYTTRTGLSYDAGDYQAALDEALRMADVESLRAEQARRVEAGEEKLLGIGIAAYVEITGFGGSELGDVRIEPDGSATVMAGTSAHGQGHATSFAMIVQDRLGIPLEKIRYVQSDTRLVRSGGGTGGSRSLQMGGSAVAAAASTVRDQARELAATLLEAAPEDIELTDEGFRVAGVPGVVVDWPALVRTASERGEELHAALDVPQDGSTFPFGAHVSVVEVDTETGLVRPLRHIAVDDCGRILNPTLVEGQQHGGVAQGISQALWEQFLYSEDGQPLTSTFADYQMPTAADTISFETANTETPTPLNELGAKGIGESGTLGSTPAVQSAVVDALKHLGVRHIDIPCTPQRIWTAVGQARAGTLPDPWAEPPAIFDTLEVATGEIDGGVEV